MESFSCPVAISSDKQKADLTAVLQELSSAACVSPAPSPVLGRAKDSTPQVVVLVRSLEQLCAMQDQSVASVIAGLEASGWPERALPARMSAGAWSPLCGPNPMAI
jgi:hypothetical protein